MFLDMVSWIVFPFHAAHVFIYTPYISVYCSSEDFDFMLYFDVFVFVLQPARIFQEDEALINKKLPKEVLIR